MDVVDIRPNSVFSEGLVLQQRYRLDNPIAVGGMAEVWQAHDLILQRAVAVKLLHPHLAADPNISERFRREAVSAARLSHPNIVPTYDAGTDGSVSYIVLGLIHGPTLAERLATDGRLSPSDAAYVVSQVADALNHAHSCGLVHRDVKPSNILMVGHDLRVMVTDFGIAKAIVEGVDTSLTLPGLVIGTPAYTAPEALTGAPVDHRADIYALGILLHELICDHTTGDHDATTVMMDGANTTPLNVHCDALPPVIASVVERATRHDPAERFSSAGEIVEALASEIHGKDVSTLTTGPTAAKKLFVDAAPTAVWAASNDPGGHAAVIESTAGTQYVDAAPAEPLAPETPAPSAKAGSPTRPSRRRHKLMLATSVVASLAILAIVTGSLLSKLGGNDPDGQSTTTSIELTGAKSFDPLGDKSENDEQLAALTDGQAATTWSTNRYNSRRFGNLKSGVGVVVTLAKPSALESIKVQSPTAGWSADVYAISGQPAADVSGWGSAVGKLNGSGTVELPAKSPAVSSILVWITDLGDSNKVSISEISVAPR